MFSKDTVSGLKAFYKVSQKIAATKKSHNIFEQLILPCCKDFISNVLGSSKLQKLKHVSSSSDTVSRQITELSDYILSQLVSKIQNSMFNFFTIQIDETIDAANLAQLCIFLYNRHLEDKFLFCENLSTKTTAREIFDKVEKFCGALAIR